MKPSICFLFAASFLILSCGDQAHNDNVLMQGDDIPSDVQSADNGTLEERAKRHVESTLSIPGTENYSLKIYKEDLDGDDKTDAIITVNRYDFALEEAASQGNTAKRAELGFMGSYNFIFYYDGGLDKISPEIAIPSTPQKELAIAFDHISSSTYKDVIIDYRIRNAKFREFYFVSNHTPRRVFQCKLFDGLGTKSTEAYHVKYAEGTMGIQKDILILNAELVQPQNEFDPLTYEPELKHGKQLIYRFFYHPKLGKYAIMK
jgi:hypothetical protein